MAREDALLLRREHRQILNPLEHDKLQHSSFSLAFRTEPVRRAQNGPACSCR